MHSASERWRTELLSFGSTCVPCVGQATSGPEDNLPEACELLLLAIVEYGHCWIDQGPFTRSVL